MEDVMGRLEELLEEYGQAATEEREAREKKHRALRAVEGYWARQVGVENVKVGDVVEVDLRPRLQWRYGVVLRAGGMVLVQRVLKNGQEGPGGGSRYVEKTRILRVCTEEEEIVRRYRAQQAAKRLVGKEA